MSDNACRTVEPGAEVAQIGDLAGNESGALVEREGWAVHQCSFGSISFQTLLDDQAHFGASGLIARSHRAVGKLPGKVRENRRHAYPAVQAMTTVPSEARPTPEDLAAELAAMLRTGITIDGCRRSPAILALALVRAKASSDDPNDLAVAANHLIREASASVDSLSEGPTAVLLAVAPGYRGTLLKARRADAAARLFISPGHLRDDREEALLVAVADELYAMDSAYRLRHRHRTEVERAPQESGLRVNWLDQHRSYRRIWTPVMALRNDLVVLLDYFSQAHAAGVTPDDVDDDARADISDRLSTMTWRLAQFSIALEQFVEREGGLWILADADSEIRAADDIYQLGLYLPFGEADVSWARLLLKRTEHEELDPYIELLVAEGDQRREFMRCWVDWAWQAIEERDRVATQMVVGATEPEHGLAASWVNETASTDCGRWLAATQEFISLVDSDWYRMADWYRGSTRP